MLIATTDIEENDVVFFNDDDEFAEVYNNSVKGEIENVYSDAIEVDDEDYEYTATVVDAGVSYYLDGDDFLVFDEDAAEDMEAAEEDVMLFLDRTGELVFVSGDLGEADTNTVAGILLEDVEYDTSFGRTYAEFVFVNEEGTKVTETVKLTDLDASMQLIQLMMMMNVSSEAEVVAANDGNALRSGQVVEFVYDEDGDIVELTFVDSRTFNSEIEVGDDYVDGTITSSVVVLLLMDGSFNLERALIKMM